MKAADFRSIVRLTNQEHWGFTSRDFRRMLALEPKGCPIAVLDRRPIGLATTISYGRKLGWIGNVVVHKNHRGTGVASSLVESAIRHLLRSHVKSIGLNSYPENKSMYERLNFRQTGAFVRLSISRQTRRLPGSRRKVPLRQILKLDGEMFGADRSRLLRRILKEFPGGWTWILRGSEVSAYSVVKQYQDSSEMGPSVCKNMNQEDVETLLQSSIAITRKWPLEVSVPESNQLVLETASRLGFRSERSGVVMSLRDLDEVAVSPAIAAFGFLDKG